MRRPTCAERRQTHELAPWEWSEWQHEQQCCAPTQKAYIEWKKLEALKQNGETELKKALGQI
jgi:hypothetical protein